MLRVFALTGCAVSAALAMLLSGCGPGLIALGGGGTGAYYGLQGGDDDGGSKSSGGNVAPTVLITAVSRGNPAEIAYTLIDPNADSCTLEIQFAVNGGNFQACEPGAGGSGSTGLSSSASGVAHTFHWAYTVDFDGRTAYQDDIVLRARAGDGKATGEWNTLGGVSVGNDAPIIDNVVFQDNSSIVLFTFSLFDQNSDPGTLEISYSIDAGQSFIPVDTDPGSPDYELVGNPPVNLAATPGGAANQIIWDSTVALLGYKGEILMLFKPSDWPAEYSEPTPGPSVVAGPYILDNSVNGPPTLQIASNLDGQSFVGKVPVQITLADQESDPATIDVKFSLDDGMSWNTATLTNQFQPGKAGPFPASPNPTPYFITWNAVVDLAQISPYVNTYPLARLRFTPRDGTVGTPRESVAFEVSGNRAPAITNIAPLQPGGNIQIIITVQDLNADPVSVLAEYSTDGQSYTALSQADFVHGSLAGLSSSQSGFANSLTWNTNLRFPGLNAANVRLRVTPTDHPPGGTPAADRTGPAFTSQPFPVINDPAGADPVDIDIVTTDAGGVPTATPVVTVAENGFVYLEATVVPSSATVQETLWRVVQEGDEWGELQAVGGGALAYATGGFALSAGIVAGDTIRVDDGLNGPVLFEFTTGGDPQAGNYPVLISGMSTAGEFADALAMAIRANPQTRILADHTGGGQVALMHEIACLLGNAASQSPGGNALDIEAAPTAIIPGPISQLSGGVGSDRVRFAAPATKPPGTEYVEIRAEIDHTGFVQQIGSTWRLYWGDPVGSVQVTPPNALLLVGQQISLTADVTPSTAPQIIEWEVVGGAVNGLVSPNGNYFAPSTAPATNPVIVRAHSIDPSVPFGFAEITVSPEPTSVQVTPSATGDLFLGETRQFNALVLPAEAPQGVNWTVWWDGQNFGSGNTTVGTVNSGGLYTAPTKLPSPPTVTLRATSQAKPSVFGTASQSLVAPPPTSFTVSPVNPTVTAGGQGVQFTATNFVPGTANPGVTWQLSTQVGQISATTGFYTPPQDTPSSQPVVLTVTARSTADTDITASTQLTVNPNPQSPPTGVTITPNQGFTFSSGANVQFSHNVLPSSASQSVTWALISPTSGGGQVNAAGLYTPPATNVDMIVTLRCATVANPAIFAQVTVCVTGQGKNWNDIAHLGVERAGPSTAWDSHNQRLWIIGGRSPASGTSGHDRNVLAITAANTLITGPTIDPLGALGDPNTIAAVYDSQNTRLLAVLGRGSVNPVEVWELNVSSLSPAPAWTQVPFTQSQNVPVLGGTHTYHAWYDAADRELQLILNSNQMYRFDCNSGSSSFNGWMSRATLNTALLSSKPSAAELCGHTRNTSNGTHYFVGPNSAASGASTRAYTLDKVLGIWTWTAFGNLGAAPGSGLRNPALIASGSTVHVFGGIFADTLQSSNNIYTVSFGGLGGATWSAINQGPEQRPMARSSARLAALPGIGTVLVGGESRSGSFGDIWRYTLGTTNPAVFEPLNLTGLRPPGRRDAAGVMVSSAGYIYGGTAAHGVDDGLWKFEYNAITKLPTWTRLAPVGTHPPALTGAAMAYDSQNQRVLLFGGAETEGASPQYSGKLFAYNIAANEWTELSPGGTVPSARRGAGAAYDQTNLRLWVFGGENSFGKLGDLYHLSLGSGLPGAWTAHTAVTGSPPDPRSGHAMGWDATKSRLLVLGGNSDVSGANHQLFEYIPAQSHWNALPIGNTGQQEHVAGSGVVWNSTCARFIHAPAVARKAQCVVMASPGAQWQYLAQPPAGNNATGTVGLYDHHQQRYYVLFGERAQGGRTVCLNLVRSVEFE